MYVIHKSVGGIVLISDSEFCKTNSKTKQHWWRLKQTLNIERADCKMWCPFQSTSISHSDIFLTYVVCVLHSRCVCPAIICVWPKVDLIRESKNVFHDKLIRSACLCVCGPEQRDGAGWMHRQRSECHGIDKRAPVLFIRLEVWQGHLKCLLCFSPQQ